ncbi:MAG: hypothetical protein KGJ02_04840 [Verrucomicrobiota bacterium]|nr:hypothetical protein [Verrucomicrobiota bacterium]
MFPTNTILLETTVNTDLLEAMEKSLCYLPNPGSEMVKGVYEWCSAKRLGKPFKASIPGLEKTVEEQVAKVVAAAVGEKIMELETQKNEFLSQCKTSKLSDRAIEAKLQRATQDLNTKATSTEKKEPSSQEETETDLGPSQAEILTADLLRKIANDLQPRIKSLEVQMQILEGYQKNPRSFMDQPIGHF